MRDVIHLPESEHADATGILEIVCRCDRVSSAAERELGKVEGAGGVGGWGALGCAEGGQRGGWYLNKTRDDRAGGEGGGPEEEQCCAKMLTVHFFIFQSFNKSINRAPTFRKTYCFFWNCIFHFRR